MDLNIPSSPSQSPVYSMREIAHHLAGKTVLQIIPNLDAGGAERTTVDIVSGLVNVGARALVASDGGRLVGELQSKGGIWVPFPASSKNPLKMLLNVRKLAKICANEGVDLIHARSRAPAWVALAAARLLRIPFVTTYHGSYTSRSPVKNLYNSVMARGDTVIANSHYTAGLIAEQHPTARNRLRVIYRGTDLLAFSPASVTHERIMALRAAWGVHAHERIVLLAARFTGWKGQRILIEAARLLQERNIQDVVFIMAGDAQGRVGYVQELDKMIAERGLSTKVRRVEHCTDMPAAFLASSVVTVPSTEPEAFGRSAVEAQAMGTPVVVSQLGAVPETVLTPPHVLPTQRTGWCVAAGDPQALADAIFEALTLGASDRDSMAQRARHHVEAHFSLSMMTNNTLDVYKTLLGEH